MQKVTVTIALKNTGAYRYAVRTGKYVRTGRVGLTLVARTPLLITVVEDLEVVYIDNFAEKDSRNEFDKRGLSDPGLSNKKDGV